ncbi:MAG: ribosome small subunit-dependent GTPase A [Bacteroides sp.]|nr:ribosome small subunit-dependent GTPase A [Bacteroides sp.]MCM1379431.1 ribosome small subunit-dependent GTPase A [Bacteroides sp.]MCM1445291.1 ribosome small subunit-dependent GTPase A [Prevotella sp.]
MHGLVISNLGSRYEVELDGTDQVVTAAAKGNLRIKGIRTTNPVAVGDRVTLSLAPGAELAYITAIDPRENYIIRRASNLSKESHILAANIDRAILVVTLKHPETSTTFIDRFLATAEAYDIPAVLVINKIDLLTDTDNIELLKAVEYLYKSIGYKVICTSVKTGEGLDELRAEVSGRVSLLSGNSGVGKSSIINALVPDARAVTAAVSDATDSGTHTTTFSRMYSLPGGGRIIDVPGVRGFGTLDFDRHEVRHFFPDIFAAGQECRFSDCLHTEDNPGCAVLKAVEEHKIALSRYASYLSILENDVEGKVAKWRSCGERR